MKNVKAVLVISTLLTILFGFRTHTFSSRQKRKKIPTIKTHWLNKPGAERYRLSNAHLGEYPTFGLPMKAFNRYLVPNKGLTYYSHDQATEQTVQGSMLNELIEQTIQELNEKKKVLTYATILQNKNFNRRQKCGLLVLQLNDYPFVVKLFRETPQTFVNPYNKGIEPICFFYMGNGANRHIAGLTRLKNRDLVAKKLAALPQWKNKVEVPRKWLWLPKDPEWIAIEGSHFEGKRKKLKTVLPGTYAIIADAAVSQKMPAFSTSKKKEIVMQLCNDLNTVIDPHFKNFIFTQNPDDQGFKIVIIDTEHFPTMVGLTERKQFKNHNDYYLYLVCKGFHDTYLQTKADRLALQKQRSEFLGELLSS